MGFYFIFGSILLLAGILFLLLPLSMQMTGLVLLAFAAIFFLCHVLRRKQTKLARRAIGVVILLACIGGVMLLALMSMVSIGGRSDWKTAETCQYGIVLGAAVQPNGKPSRVLQSRIDAAAEFLERNPTAKLVVSGSQGGDEPMTEAECMYTALVERGADPNRIRQENQSHTTQENLENSWKIIESDGGTSGPVAIITSEFHLSRSCYIAGRLGIKATPVAAKTKPGFYRVNYTLREVFAFVKAMITKYPAPAQI